MWRPPGQSRGSQGSCTFMAKSSKSKTFLTLNWNVILNQRWKRKWAPYNLIFLNTMHLKLKNENSVIVYSAFFIQPRPVELQKTPLVYQTLSLHGVKTCIFTQLEAAGEVFAWQCANAYFNAFSYSLTTGPSIFFRW